MDLGHDKSFDCHKTYTLLFYSVLKIMYLEVIVKYFEKYRIVNYLNDIILKMKNSTSIAILHILYFLNKFQGYECVLGE